MSVCRRCRRQDRARDDADQLAGVPEPYRLRVVAHSLGGAALLIYAVQCRRQRRPHHIYRLILLTPAGFLQKMPLVRAGPPALALRHAPPSCLCGMPGIIKNNNQWQEALLAFTQQCLLPVVAALHGTCCPDSSHVCLASVLFF